jgi:hypothetical protein
MTIYVTEINGRGIVAFNCDNRNRADELIAEDSFRSNLRVLENQEGTALWNGSDEIFVREAFPEEQAKFSASQARAINTDEIDGEDDVWLMYPCAGCRSNRWLIDPAAPFHSRRQLLAKAAIAA